MSDPRYITILSADPILRVTALRGETPPVPDMMDGGWTVVARPRRTALTQWDGSNPIAMPVSLLLDGYATDSTVEPDCDQLEQMWRPLDGGEPPLVRVLGVVPHADLDWIVQSLEWDAAPIFSPSGYRVRQAVVVRLLEYVGDDRDVTMTAAERARRNALGSRAAGANGTLAPAVYTVVEGDTLASVAAFQLGDYRRWAEIADLNEIRDPDRVSEGDQLRLP